ncbi:MAG: hypothetical protein A3F42_03850 [Gammaproteobacteria bacterium RIFCSPHIGHO2_12_FULL_37_34]|nr:MAG: hypothetical protein A3F42_03850 [Gammaproteobacteria bacterium RIFCSPHIGHO2_12_FULL_37_34]
MKLNYLILLLIFPFTTMAQSVPITNSVEIVSPAKMFMTDPMRKQDALDTQELKSKGYISSDTTNAQYLLNIKNLAPSEIKMYQSSKNPYDTHLKQSITQIPLAFLYTGISGVTPEHIIGFAPTGTYIKTGWTGIKEVFEDDQLGVCSLNIENRQLVNMQIRINSERLSYAVNSKPTTTQVEGNPKSGYRYSVFWTSGKYECNLDCSNKDFDSSLLNKVIAYADKIDKSF